jgi:Raf kinase inhibitor-like YbhB/YbcL family protein
MQVVKEKLLVRSGAFEQGAPIPDEYSGYHENRSPSLSWSGLPAGTRSVAVVCEDPDAPMERPFVHWLAANIPTELTAIEESVPGEPAPPKLKGGIQGTNDARSIGWFGPRPPAGHGVHHYHFRVFALDAMLDLEPGFRREELIRAMQGHVLVQGETMGAYEREG